MVVSVENANFHTQRERDSHVEIASQSRQCFREKPTEGRTRHDIYYAWKLNLVRGQQRGILAHDSVRGRSIIMCEQPFLVCA